MHSLKPPKIALHFNITVNTISVVLHVRIIKLVIKMAALAKLDIISMIQIKSDSIKIVYNVIQPHSLNYLEEAVFNAVPL